MSLMTSHLMMVPSNRNYNLIWATSPARILTKRRPVKTTLMTSIFAPFALISDYVYDINSEAACETQILHDDDESWPSSLVKEKF